MISELYFQWMLDLVQGHGYQKLLRHMNSIEFTPQIHFDENRVNDGLALRMKFAEDQSISIGELYFEIGADRCSILEMIVALARRMDSQILYSTEEGDRTYIWFGQMVHSLGLDCMDDTRYDPYIVEEVLDAFLNHQYNADGSGGLFTIEGCQYDLRGVEIWKQMYWYVNKYIL